VLSTEKVLAFELANALHKHEEILQMCEAHQTWNCDETGIIMVQVPERIIVQKGERQIASLKRSECGTLVTMSNVVLKIKVLPMLTFENCFLRCNSYVLFSNMDRKRRLSAHFMYGKEQ